ncbi:MAG: baseplate J/gp47 family protein [Cyanobacteriota bacterium]
MVFEQKSFTQIFEAMRDRTPPSLTDFTEGSVVRTMYESFAYELAVLYAQMEKVYLSAYVDTAEGAQLDMVVAILGIKRGEPDFAAGTVTFKRDLGIDEDIVIPLGTLVTTEDTEAAPKKAYQTIEFKTIPRNQKSVRVRVQAVRRGEIEVTDAQTITVMPQPVPGVKSVTNEERIAFTGKQRETDEELRDRAKKTLLAASGANITAIENALISLPGVRGVQVRENFHFARGKVTLTKSGEGEVKIPKGTKLTITDKSFKTTKNVTLSNNQPIEVDVKALVQGEVGELIEGSNNWDKPADYPEVTVRNAEPILLKDFGMIEVFVDGIDFTDNNKVSQLKQEIDRVRAAGIYVLLRAAESVTIDGVFQIELATGLKLSPEEQTKLEEQVQNTIIAYINEQRIGQPLLISQITKKILEIKGVNDLTEFTFYTQREGEDKEPVTNNKRLDVDILERVTAGSIRVASGIKSLLVDVQIKAQNLDETEHKKIEKALQQCFKNKAQGQSITKSEIEAQISNVEVKLIPHYSFWQPSKLFDGETVEISIVEQLQLKSVFIYERFLDITGALKLTFRTTTTSDEQQQAYAGVRIKIEEYLENLQPEQDVEIEKIVQATRTVTPVLSVAWRLEDFRVFNVEKPEERVNNNQISVKKFEKPRLATNFIIASQDSELRSVKINITAVTLRLNLVGQIPEDNSEQISAAIKTAIAHIFTQPLHQELQQKIPAGKAVIYEHFKTDFLLLIRQKALNLSLETLQSLTKNDNQIANTARTFIRNADYKLDKLVINGDDEHKNIFIRSVEKAEIQPISLAGKNLEITFEIPPAAGS